MAGEGTVIGEPGILGQTVAPVDVIVGKGLITMMNDESFPAHPLAVGIALIVPVFNVLVVFVPVKEGILPVPFAIRPIPILLFVQVVTEFAGQAVKLGIIMV